MECAGSIYVWRVLKQIYYYIDRTYVFTEKILMCGMCALTKNKNDGCVSYPSMSILSKVFLYICVYVIASSNTYILYMNTFFFFVYVQERG